MVSIKEVVTDVINELIRLQSAPSSHRDKDDSSFFPRMIGVGDGRSIIVSKKIDIAIRLVADQLLAEDPSLAPKVVVAEWRQMVRNSFGPALAMVDLDDPVEQNAFTIINEVRSNASKHVAQYGPRESSFGCTLFSSSAIESFSIGPVRFEPRLAWLDRASSDNAVSSLTRRRIEQIWSGKIVKKRKASVDSFIEQNILDAIGTCEFVCSVKTAGLAPEAAQERALTTARLAFASIALLWTTPSQALEGMNLLYDRRTHRKIVLTFIPGKTVVAGSRLSHKPHGPWLGDGEWETLFAENSNYFAVVAEILDFIVDKDRGQSRSDLLNTLAQALLWFHEGCRDTSTLMGIVKFSATLDSLACGGKSSGIKRLITARLGLKEASPIRPDGPTMKAAVDQIYSEGRSRTIHGTNTKLSHDWSGTKSLAEQFARLCLCACIDWAAANPTEYDPKKLSV